MNIFFVPIIMLVAPPVLLARWGLKKAGIEDPQDWQICGVICAAVFAAVWISGIWLAP